MHQQILYRMDKLLAMYLTEDVNDILLIDITNSLFVIYIYIHICFCLVREECSNYGL